MEGSVQVNPSNPETVVEVIKIISLDHESYSYLSQKQITKLRVRELVLRLFKTTTAEQESVKKAKKHKKKKSKKQKVVNDQETQKSDLKQKYFKIDANRIIPDEVKLKYPWILSSDPINEAETISRSEFASMMIELLKISLSLLNLKYEEVLSVSKKEKYLKVSISENDLIEYAKNMNYRLKRLKQPDWSFNFQQNSLYAPITFAKSESDYEYLFVKYNQNGEESTSTENSSFFTFVDKYRILNFVLSSSFDLSALVSEGIILTRFVLHEEGILNELKNDWANFYKIFPDLPLYRIKTYYSEQIAFYFGFSQIYKNFIRVLAVIGLLVYGYRIFNHYFVDAADRKNIIYLYETYCVFLIIWGIMFNKYWERKEKLLAWEWGTFEVSDQQIQREEYKGEFTYDEVTGMMKTINREHFKYFLIKLLSFIGSLSFMALGFLCKVMIPVFVEFLTDIKPFSDEYNHNKAAQLIYGLLTGFQINFFNVGYSILAKKLTNFENHETMQEHNDSLIIKLFIFRFINSYLTLLKIALLHKDCDNNSCMSQLGYQLMIIFSTSIFFNFIELAMPWIKFWFKTHEGPFWRRSIFESETDEKLIKLESQALMEPYDYAINDFMEILTNYGYLALFGSSHHLIGTLALIGLVIENRVDAIKLCSILKRPEPYKIDNIGVWKKLFLFVSLCGIFTNLALSIFTTGYLKTLRLEDKGLMFIGLENMALVVFVIIWAMIPDRPKRVNEFRGWSKRIHHEMKTGEMPGKKRHWGRANFVQEKEIDFSEMIRRKSRAGSVIRLD